MLEEIGALDDGRQLTDIGKKLSRLPVDPAHRPDDPRRRAGGRPARGADHRRGARRARPAGAPARGAEAGRRRAPPLPRRGLRLRRAPQALALLPEAQGKRTQNQLRKLCRDSFLSYVRMREWIDVHTQLSRIVREMGLPPERGGRRRRGRAPRAPPGPAQPRRHVAHRAAASTWARGRRASSSTPRRASRRSRPRGWSRPSWWRPRSSSPATAAKIDPAWLEAAGGALCKRSYGDPHWAEQPAQVMAKEQRDPLRPARGPRSRVHFGPIDPKASRRLFILHALVRQEYALDAPFVDHNRALFDEVRRLRDRARRSDMLADDDAVAVFFEARCRTASTAARPSRPGARRPRPKTRGCSASRSPTCSSGEAEDLSPARFPETLASRARRLPLSYRFDPGEDDDGITVDRARSPCSRSSTRACSSGPSPAGTPRRSPSSSTALPQARCARRLVPVPELARTARREPAPLRGADAPRARPRRPRSHRRARAARRVGPRRSAALSALLLPRHRRRSPRRRGPRSRRARRSGSPASRARRGPAPAPRLGARGAHRVGVRRAAGAGRGGARRAASLRLSRAASTPRPRWRSARCPPARPPTRRPAPGCGACSCSSSAPRWNAGAASPAAVAMSGLADAVGAPRRQIALRALDDAFAPRRRSRRSRARAPAFNERCEAGKRRLPGVLAELGRVAQEIGAELDKARATLRGLAGKPGAPKAALDDVRAQLGYLVAPGLFAQDPAGAARALAALPARHPATAGAAAQRAAEGPGQGRAGAAVLERLAAAPRESCARAACRRRSWRGSGGWWRSTGSACSRRSCARPCRCRRSGWRRCGKGSWRESGCRAAATSSGRRPEWRRLPGGRGQAQERALVPAAVADANVRPPVSARARRRWLWYEGSDASNPRSIVARPHVRRGSDLVRKRRSLPAARAHVVAARAHVVAAALRPRTERRQRGDSGGGPRRLRANSSAHGRACKDDARLQAPLRGLRRDDLDRDVRDGVPPLLADGRRQGDRPAQRRGARDERLRPLVRPRGLPASSLRKRTSSVESPPNPGDRVRAHRALVTAGAERRAPAARRAHHRRQSGVERVPGVSAASTRFR